MSTSILGLFMALLIATGVQASIITNDSYFYGLSPPVYPSPNMPNGVAWNEAHSKANALVSKMTLEEKANISVGYTPVTGCSGETGTVPRLNWPGLCLSDAGNGLRNTDFVNGYPSGIHVGASWNRDLAYSRAFHMGGEFKTKGVNVALGPVVGPLGRVAEGGRNWEGFTNDPYLSGQLVSQTITGIQKAGVISCVKHYIAYEQEANRQPVGNVSSVSSNLDDRTIHELYLWPFADAIHAGAGSVMCSYNKLNGSYACQNSKTLNGLLKQELGFEGFVVSDWNAEHSGVAAAEAGLDMAMPTSPYRGLSGESLVEAVKNGSLPESRLSDIATRVLASWYQMQQSSGFPERGIGMPIQVAAPHKPIYARNPISATTLLTGAIEGHVLVKNQGALPLKSPKSLSIFGYDAAVPAIADVTSLTAPDGIGPWSFGFEAINFTTSTLLTLASYGGTFPEYAVGGSIVSGGGSGANAPAYISAPFDALQQQAIKDGTTLFWDFTSQNPVVDPNSDACLVFINAFASEGADRTALSDSYSDTLIESVASECSNTIVTIHNAGIRLVDQWITNPNVTAVIFAHLPGQDSGRALVDILYGVQSPSGKLPYTVAKSASDYNVLGPSLPKGEYALYPQSDFSEQLLIDYRYFDAHNITPRFEFGFGLTYTTFRYSRLSITQQPGISETYLPPSAPTVQGGNPFLWEVVARVTAEVTNSGTVQAAEVAQLYVSIPGGDTPVRQLRGFDKVTIPKGATVQVEFDLLRRDLSVWDVEAQEWGLRKGTYQIYVGASSRDLPLEGTLVLK